MRKNCTGGLLILGSLSIYFVLSGCFGAGSGTQSDSLTVAASKEMAKFKLPPKFDYSHKPTPKPSSSPLPPNTTGNQNYTGNYTSQTPTGYNRQQSPSIMEMQQAEERRREETRQNAQVQQLQQENQEEQWKQEEQQRQEEQQQRFQEVSRENHLRDLQAEQQEDLKNLQRKNNDIDAYSGSPGFKAFQKDVAQKDFERHQESRDRQIADINNGQSRWDNF